MSPSFSRTFRSLDADGSRRNVILLALVAGLLGAWTTWFVAARVGVYAATSHARLEVDREQHAVGAPVSGRVLGVDLAVGRRVQAGDVLLELDAESERLAMAEEEVRLAPTAAQVEALKRERAAQEQALADDRRSAQSAIAEAEARARQAASAAAFAEEEAGRLSTLRARGLVSDLDALRAANAARERADEAQTAQFAARRARGEIDVRAQDRLARIARLQREITELEGTAAEAAARTMRLQHDIDRRAVRAPIGGTLAEVAPLRSGAVVAEGDRLATIVPDGDLKVVAFLTPAALGRVRPGQPARVRLEAFPWTQYGSASARVVSVAGEPRDGQVRVELVLTATGDLPVPIQHGLPAEVDIEVERVSPAVLVLRTVASRTRLLASEQ